MVSEVVLKKVRILLIILVIVIAVFVIRAAAEPVERVAITFTIANDSDPNFVGPMLELLAEQGATATFFVTGAWATANTETITEIAKRNEVACQSASGIRLTQLQEPEAEIVGCKDIVMNLTGVEPIGFRAPANELGPGAFAIIAQHYTYDSSTYGNYGWFWEKPPAGIVMLPVSSVFFLPLDDRVAVKTLKLGDTFYFLARKMRRETVILGFTPERVSPLDLEYLIAYYQARDVPVTSVAVMLEGD